MFMNRYFCQSWSCRPSKDAFFAGGGGFYTQAVDDALVEIVRLPGRHLYFLDDHLLGHRRFTGKPFEGLRGMGRVFQGAATVDSVLRGDLIERAADAGLRSLFVGFESINADNHRLTGKVQNVGRDAARVVRRLDDLGIMLNASFVFGLDGDAPDVFDPTAHLDFPVGFRIELRLRATSPRTPRLHEAAPARVAGRVEARTATP